MLEEDRVARAQVDLGHRHDLALHLARTGAEMDLGHVLDPRSFAPSRFAHQIPDIERRAASPARKRGLVVHALAPLALDTLQWLGRCRVCRVAHREQYNNRTLSSRAA